LPLALALARCYPAAAQLSRLVQAAAVALRAPREVDVAATGRVEENEVSHWLKERRLAHLCSGHGQSESPGLNRPPPADMAGEGKDKDTSRKKGPRWLPYDQHIVVIPGQSDPDLSLRVEAKLASMEGISCQRQLLSIPTPPKFQPQLFLQ